MFSSYRLVSAAARGAGSRTVPTYEGPVMPSRQPHRSTASP